MTKMPIYPACSGEVIKVPNINGSIWRCQIGIKLQKKILPEIFEDLAVVNIFCDYSRSQAEAV